MCICVCDVKKLSWSGYFICVYMVVCMYGIVRFVLLYTNPNGTLRISGWEVCLCEDKERFKKRH